MVIKKSRKNANNAIKGNLLKITGFSVITQLPVIAALTFFFINTFGLMLGVFSGTTSSTKLLLNMLLTSTILSIIGYGCQCTMNYGVIHLNEYNELPKFKDAFKNGYSRILRTCIAFFLMALIIQIGLQFFIIPGAIFAHALSAIPFMLLDEDYEDLSAFRLIKESFEFTNGYKLPLFNLAISMLPKIMGLMFIPLLLSMFLGGVTILVYPFAFSYLFFYVISAQYNMYAMIKEEKYGSLEDYEESECA